MKFQLATEININATAKKVWNILLDFNAYPDWNPFISSINGNPEVGERLTARIADMTIKPKVIDVQPGKRFSWQGSMGIKGIFDGHHQFDIADNENGTVTLYHYEHFNGLLVGAFKKMLDTKTKDGFNAMNKAIKARAEVA
jgi:hypothetical protein